MPYVVAAICLVGIFCVFNLLLTLGVIRGLRKEAPLPERRLHLPVGADLGEFSAITTRGRHLTKDSLEQETLVAFLSPGCEPCKDALPKFIEHANTSGSPTLAVMVSSGEGLSDMTAQLEKTSEVVQEGIQGPIGTAFEVTGTPAFVTVRGGKVLSTGLPRIKEELPV
ncbi:hypothetical protein [Streptosporangium sp. NPDC023615]|uniref:TlpA family protein disulfide reductase n=1 Tax=Streptosporangium sp. NPDC023615 TaxID=3154794 RepID=UPI003429B277